MFKERLKKKLDLYVDDFFNNTVYQFHGCFYHGCPNCFHPYDYNPVTNEKYCNLYSRTKKFTYRLGVVIRNGVTGKGASTANLQYRAFTLIRLIHKLY